LKTVRLELKSLRVTDDISNDLKLYVGVERKKEGRFTNEKSSTATDNVRLCESG